MLVAQTKFITYIFTLPLCVCKCLCGMGIGHSVRQTHLWIVRTKFEYKIRLNDKSIHTQSDEIVSIVVAFDFNCQHICMCDKVGFVHTHYMHTHTYIYHWGELESQRERHFAKIVAKWWYKKKNRSRLRFAQNGETSAFLSFYAHPSHRTVAHTVCLYIRVSHEWMWSTHWIWWWLL